MKPIALLVALIFTLPLAAQEKHPELKVLEPYIGTWSASLGENVNDVTKWEWIMGGNAIQITHSINDGGYGGRSILHWNNAKEAITYRYVTTARFYTEGLIEVKENGDLYVEETVYGNMNGANATKSGYSIKEGKMHTWSELKYGDKWAERSESVYTKTPEAKVNFKD